METFADKLSSFFDRRFVVAYWLPCFICVWLVGTGFAFLEGPMMSLTWFANQTATTQIILAASVLLCVTVLAYLFQGITVPLLRIYEGYWPRYFAPLASVARARQKKGFLKSSDQDQYYNFPSDIAKMRPTRLGNILRAAEEYPRKLYLIDSVLWWPRLIPLFPETFRTQLDAVITPLFALLNLCSLLVFLTVIASIMFPLYGQPWWMTGPVIVGMLCIARLCYRTALGQAVEYGNMIRVAFDLYRHEILKQMRIPLPNDLAEERILWSILNDWIYNYKFPWESGWPPDPGVVKRTFYYDVQQSLPNRNHEEQIAATSNLSTQSSNPEE